jgi:hypothetical protein
VIKDELLNRAQEAEELAHYLLDFASKLRSQPSAGEQPRLFWPESRGAMSKAVAGILTLRNRRAKHIDASLFGEPAWDMLLTLFKAHLSQTDLTVEQVCKSGCPYETTSRRWLAVLVDHCLVEVTSDGRYELQRTVCLTERGKIGMTKSFLDFQESSLI